MSQATTTYKRVDVDRMEEHAPAAADERASAGVRWLIIPNLALQRLTTREPDRDMLEVAIAAFQSMRAQEKVAVA